MGLEPVNDSETLDEETPTSLPVQDLVFLDSPGTIYPSANKEDEDPELVMPRLMQESKHWRITQEEVIHGDREKEVELEAGELEEGELEDGELDISSSEHTNEEIKERKFPELLKRMDE